MKNLLILAALALLVPACQRRHTVVVEERHAYEPSPAPPPAPAPVYVPAPPPPAVNVTVTTSAGTFGWTHVRHVVYTEYYGCSQEEIYYLDRSGYDEDDILVLSFIARRARVPLRWVCTEYARCGRSLFNVALAFNVSPFDFYCQEIPVGYACPGPYGRAYGYYWRRDPVYLNNAECHALIQLQIGVRYYGHAPAVYFQKYEDCRQRAEPHPFRAVVVRDYSHCGRGNINVSGTVIVKKERPWEAPHVRDWEDRHRREQESLKVRITVQHERDEEEKTRRALDDDRHKKAVEASRSKITVMKEKRVEVDRLHPPKPDPVRPPVPAPAARPNKLPDPERAAAPRPEEKKPERKPAEEPREKPRTEERKPERPVEKPAPPPERKPVEEPREKPAPGRKPAEEPKEKPRTEERKPERPVEKPAPPPERKPERKPVEEPKEKPRSEERKPERPVEKPAPPPERKPERKPESAEKKPESKSAESKEEEDKKRKK